MFSWFWKKKEEPEKRNEGQRQLPVIHKQPPASVMLQFVDEEFENKFKDLQEEKARQVVSIQKMALIQKMKGENCGETAEKLVREDLPPILQNRFEHLLPLIVSVLDPTSFLRLIRTTKKIYNLAQKGIIKVALKLECHTFDLRSDRLSGEFYHQFLTYKDKLLRNSRLCRLQRSNWFRVELSTLFIDDDLNADYELHRLLSIANVTYIDKVIIKDGEIDLDYLLKRCEIRYIKANGFSTSDFLRSPYIRKVPHVDITLDYCESPDEDRKNAMHFLENTIASYVSLCGAFLYPESASFLIKEWINGQRQLPKHLVFDIQVVPNCQFLGDILKKISHCHLGEDLSRIDAKTIKEKIDPLEAPLVACGHNDSFVVIRKDYKMTRIVFEGFEYNDIFDVKFDVLDV